MLAFLFFIFIFFIMVNMPALLHNIFLVSYLSSGYVFKYDGKLTTFPFFSLYLYFSFKSCRSLFHFYYLDIGGKDMDARLSDSLSLVLLLIPLTWLYANQRKKKKLMSLRVQDSRIQDSRNYQLILLTNAIVIIFYMI